MNYFKRFTNFFGGFAAFAAILHLIGEYMTFKLPEGKEEASKLGEFLSAEQTEFFRGYVVLAALFVISAILGRLFERLPYVTLAVSLLPLYQTVSLYADGKLENFPALYLLFAILHTSGSAVHALVLDKRDGGRRGFISAAVLGTAMSAGGLWLWKKIGEFSSLEDQLAIEELGRVDTQIASASSESLQKLVLTIVIMVAASVAISLILKDIYFIDAILALVPFVYAVDKVLLDEKIAIFGELTIILCALYLAVRILLVIFEPMRDAKGGEKSDARIETDATEAAE